MNLGGPEGRRGRRAEKVAAVVPWPSQMAIAKPKLALSGGETGNGAHPEGTSAERLVESGAEWSEQDGAP